MRTFFREAVHEEILKYKRIGGKEDEYSICFSKFGPRVSTSKPIYSANETSTLATKLLDLKKMDFVDVLIEGKKSDDAHTGENLHDIEGLKKRAVIRYNIHAIEADEIGNSLWESIADLFADRYTNIFENLFNAGDNEISLRKCA
jgi:hypothetical protein